MIAQGWTPEGYGDGVSLCSSSGGTTGSVALTKTTQMVGGLWTFTYNYGQQYADTFRFTSVQANTGSGSADTPYYMYGTNKYGENVLGGWVLTIGKFMLISKLVTSYDVYVFDFSGTNAITGCYYYDNNVGNVFDDPCTPLSGVRTAGAWDNVPLSAPDDSAFQKSLHQSISRTLRGNGYRSLDSHLRAMQEALDSISQ